uniref:Uncharacterized protein n=2 Tax=Leptocylindrus danicus TaxID=163516 RepID=A0A7S2LCA7_9STRA|mmetsp:Transcript_3618/g.5267  ORF Transcript_3618/g.5267 Transcript_3618/m.5267 type:complete len:135 (+) Transcript_3618:178-582(+)
MLSAAHPHVNQHVNPHVNVSVPTHMNLAFSLAGAANAAAYHHVGVNVGNVNAATAGAVSLVPMSVSAAEYNRAALSLMNQQQQGAGEQQQQQQQHQLLYLRQAEMQQQQQHDAGMSSMQRHNSAGDLHQYRRQE